ncbi:ATP-binding cassette domain-containing protein [Nocardioides zeae]
MSETLGSPTTGTTGGVRPVLQIDDVKVHFGGVKAVDGISMELMPGMIHGIIGPNGSGKSTLIGAVTRLTRLTSGRLLFDGEEYQGAPRRWSPASGSRARSRRCGSCRT